MKPNEFGLMRALIVDDDPFMRDLVRMTLQQMQVGHVEVAASGESAIALLQRPGPIFNILLCDLQMPGMDGIELLRNLGQLNYNQGVILFSGADERVLRAAVSLAREYFLNVLGSVQKPVTAKALRRFLNRYETDCQARQDGQYAAPLTAGEFRQSLQSGQLTLFYQPQIDIRTGEVVGVEALARLLHPRYGLLCPSTFIPLTEQGESLELFTETVFRQALEQAQRWRQQGHNFKVSINTCSAALGLVNLPTLLAEHCARLKLDSHRITVEITETQLDVDATASLEAVTRLRLRGLGLSIDDFGTGYSSLERLKRIPFDELKIDGSFVHGAVRDKAARAILESSVALGKQLSLCVLVEGVEDPEDWALAAELDCDVAQGFLIAQPMAAEDLANWLGNWEGLDSVLR